MIQNFSNFSNAIGELAEVNPSEINPSESNPFGDSPREGYLSIKSNDSANDSANDLSREGDLSREAQTLRRYLIACYDYDISSIRCRRCGSPIYRIADDQLVALWQSHDYDYVKFANALERLVAYSPISVHWVNTSASNLNWLRLNRPHEYLRYCINSLVEDLAYYQTYFVPRLNDLSWEGKFLLASDFWRFAEEYDKALAEGYLADQTLVADLIDKVTLLLAIGGVSRLKALAQSEMGFDWFLAELKSRTLAESLDRLINQILNEYRAKHSLHFGTRLTIADIEKIASQEKRARLDKEQHEKIAMANYRKAQHFQSLKKTSPKDPFLEGLIGELMAVNHDKVDYINRLTERKAQQIIANKSTVRLNQALANVTSPTRNPIIKAVSLTSLVVKGTQNDQVNDQ